MVPPPAASPDAARLAAALPARVGIGLKPLHYAELLARLVAADAGRPDLPASDLPAFVEVHPQNYFSAGGPPHRWLAAIAAHLPLSLHSTGLSLGSADGLNRADLAALGDLLARYPVAAVSDHLSFCGNAHDRVADLLPIPYTAAALAHFAGEVDRAQQALGRRLLIENPSRMLAFADDELAEPEFLNALVARSGCGLLLDLNNIIVSAGNLRLCPDGWLDRLDLGAVGELHLAGHAREDHPGGPLLIDDHGGPVGADALALLAAFTRRAGRRPALVEWDNAVPPLADLLAEAARIAAVIDAA